GRWGGGEVGRWGDGEMGRWGGRGRWGGKDFYQCPMPHALCPVIYLTKLIQLTVTTITTVHENYRLP
ncbi:MAG: hypothetical protein EAZ87_17085, partial [Nostocales cyanobacterium]